jgi:hypothetical protein
MTQDPLLSSARNLTSEAALKAQDSLAARSRKQFVPLKMPYLNASTELGRAGICAYAERAGVTPQAVAKRFDPPLTPAIMGAAIAEGLPSASRSSTCRVGGNSISTV